MARKRTLIEPPHKAIRRAIDAHAAIGEPPGERELQEPDEQDAGASAELKPARQQRRGSGGRFA